MRWKQFLTPVQSCNSEQAMEYLKDKSSDEVTILDVRQAKEYEAERIPGSKLIPLPELLERIGEIDPKKPTLVY